jgi:hypothetical protein
MGHQCLEKGAHPSSLHLARNTAETRDGDLDSQKDLNHPEFFGLKGKSGISY